MGTQVLLPTSPRPGQVTAPLSASVTSSVIVGNNSTYLRRPCKVSTENNAWYLVISKQTLAMVCPVLSKLQ